MEIRFAPLQGHTDAAYRRLHCTLVGGVDAYHVPFLRMEKGEPRQRDLKDLGKAPSDEVHGAGQEVPQVIARDGHEFGLLCDAVAARGWNQVELNAGCPFPMQAKSGRGCGLVPDAGRFREIAEAMSLRHGRDGTRFLLKMRLGMTSGDECMALLPLVNGAPLSLVTLHPRTGAQGYRGAMDLEAFGRFAEGCIHPVAFNGDVKSAGDVRAVMERFPNLAGVMIGRGLLARPCLAKEIRLGKEASEGEVVGAILSLHDGVLEDARRRLAGDVHALDRMRAFWEYPGESLPRKALKAILKARTLERYLSAVDDVRRGAF